MLTYWLLRRIVAKPSVQIQIRDELVVRRVLVCVVQIIPIGVVMFLAVVAVVILLMKIAEINPVANWDWWQVMLPFALLFFWWEFLSKWIGWDKRTAERKMAEDMKQSQETKKKNRGF